MQFVLISKINRQSTVKMSYNNDLFHLHEEEMYNIDETVHYT